MKLWLDDVRTPPDETWLKARTVDAAIAMMKTGRMSEASLDHDLTGENESVSLLP